MSETNRIDVATFLLRASLGVMFIAHALLKVVVFTIPGTVQFFESVGLPGALAYPTIAAEIAGGALLIAGVYPRLVAAALLPILLGAAWVHHGNGWVFNAPNGGWEYPVFLALVSIVVVLLPAGRLAITRTTGAATPARQGLARA